MAEGVVLALTGSQLAGMSSRFAVAAACIVFVPIALLCAALPAALRLAVDIRHVGRDVGAVVALNSIGGIAGTVLTGFVLVPGLGLVRTLAALSIAAAVVGIFAVMRGPTARRARWVTPAIGLAATFGAILTPPHRLASLLPGARDGTNDEDSRALVCSFLDVFPHLSLWTTEFHEMLLIGSFPPIELDAPRIAARFDKPEVAAALREVGIASPAALLATWVTDRAGLERYVEDAPPVTDDRPRIEYATWVRQQEFRRVLPRLLALRTMPPLHGAAGVFLAAVADERDRLLRFYDAGLHAYNGERELWAREMKRVLSEDGRNPYYRWFVGGDR